LIYVVSGFHSDGPGVVTIVEMAGWRTVATVTLVGEAASPVLDARKGLLYVPVTDADTSAGAVAVVDVVQGRVRATVRVGKAPWAVALDNSGKRLYVSSESPARVFVIDTVAARVVAKINVRTSPQYLLVDSARSRAYAVQGAGINVIDTRRNRLVATVRQAISVEGAPPVLDSTSRLIYAVDADANAVAVISTRNNKVTARIPLVDYGESAILDKAAARLYVSNFDEGVGRTLSVVDTRKRVLLGTIAVGKGPQTPVLDASNRRLYVPNWVSGTVSVVDTQLVP
jgi:YVTN family beta-propeller protein